MIATSGSAKKMLLPWLPSRWAVDLLRLRELVAEGAIGKVFHVRRTVAGFATRCDWQTERAHGGGYLLNWGPHIVDTALCLLGRPVTSAYGVMKQVINPGDVEDVFLALLTLEGGAVVQAEYTIAVDKPPTWFIQGDRGTLVARNNEITLHKQTPAQPGDPTKFVTMQADAAEVTTETVEGAIYGDQVAIYAEIARALRGEKPYPVTPQQALELTRVLDAIRTSAEEDRVVTM